MTEGTVPGARTVVKKTTVPARCGVVRILFFKLLKTAADTPTTGVQRVPRWRAPTEKTHLDLSRALSHGTLRWLLYAEMGAPLTIANGSGEGGDGMLGVDGDARRNSATL